jgi:hypothetical protein
MTDKISGIVAAFPGQTKRCAEKPQGSLARGGQSQPYLKEFAFGPDGRMNIEFRSEFFNIFNRAQFGYPGQTQGSTSFGVVSSQQNLPRLVQFALRFGF